MNLEEATEKVKASADVKVFIDFLEAFKSEEEQHIRSALNPEDPKDFNLRNANLCAEAHATASLMIESIEA